MEDIKLKINNFFSKIKNKNIVFIIILGLSGIILIFLSEVFSEENNAESIEDENAFYVFSEDVSMLESRLENAVLKIKGAGKTDITITFDSSKEFIYAKNSSENIGDSESEIETEIVVIDGKNGEEPLFIKSKEAKVRGVLVVCEGGENPLVREKIIEAVCALLDIPSNKVSVAKMA